MTAATFHSSLAEEHTPRKRGLLARFFDAMAEARMRQAVRELAMHRGLVPDDLLKRYGYAATLKEDSAYPFTR